MRQAADEGLAVGLRANIANNINGTEEFQKPFFIILNFAVGGSWPGNPDGSTVFPAHFDLDWIHVTQAGSATATATAAATASMPAGPHRLTDGPRVLRSSWRDPRDLRGQASCLQPRLRG